MEILTTLGAEEDSLLSLFNYTEYNCDVDVNAYQSKRSVSFHIFKVIKSMKKIHQRCYLEAWHIRKNKCGMNRDNGTLPLVYSSLLHQK